VTILLYLLLLFPLHTSFLYTFFYSIYKRGGDRGGRGKRERQNGLTFCVFKEGGRGRGREKRRRRKRGGALTSPLNQI
jgi:hypothetical protein